MNEDTAIAKARAVATSSLKELMPIARGEELVPVSVSYHQQMFWPAEGEPYSEVLEQMVEFSRLVDGVPVLGAGCRAVISIDNDGALTGFNIAWSEYAVEPIAQQTVDLSTIESRVKTLQEKALLPREYHKLRGACGYYDTGVIGGQQSAYVQPACSYEYQYQGEGFLYLVNVPGALDFTTESVWPESVALAKRR